MLYGDLGRYPLSIMLKKRIIGFWYKLTHYNYNLSSVLYKYLYKDFSVNGHQYGWFSNVKSILDACGLSYIWQSQYFPGSKYALLNLVETSLKDQYRQNWNSDIVSSSKCINYRIYKSEFRLENCYINVHDNLMQPLVDFRLCNNHLPIEKGRWLGIDRNDRKCNLCTCNEIGDEFHYLLRCPYFMNARKMYLPTINMQNVNILTFKNIMCENDPHKIDNLSKYLKIVCKTFKNPPGNNI